MEVSDLSFDVKEFLKKASMAHGVSGYEFMNARAVCEEAMKEVGLEVRNDTFGNAIGVRRGEGAEPRPKIMLAGHMDEIGLMVTKIEEKGFLRFTQVGGVDPRILPGHEVIVFGKRPLTGLIGVKPPTSLRLKKRRRLRKCAIWRLTLGFPRRR